ncbi:MAG: chemotaxis-specific protein-glutamate methyltransferase CheB [Sorangiineae bacterium]|nr:chemotaxis-specific protein-glutamate methyltransferase CheB [Polyangiaceae bacterium]MEB2323154.1 chemotaxis-specific protein-glutamate methyltransferase CheB [Sorangiineae bacterium]
MTGALRVLVVDDSAFMRGAVARVIESDSRFVVAGQARDGREAVALAAKLRPDLITMDFNMPELNGAEATRAILAARAVPIVMLSAHTSDGATATVEALAAGAVDFVEKPDGEVSANLSSIKEALLAKLALAAGARVLPAPTAASAGPPSEPASKRLRAAPRAMPPGLRLVVIASSTGGPAALVRVLPRLELRGAALVIVQHMPAGYTAALAEQLAEKARFPVREARAGDALEPGRALVAPGDRHLVIERSGRISLSDSPLVHGVRPAADVTLKGAALAFGARAVGVVLTGMGRDGALGLAAMRAAGARTVAQSSETCTVYGMPKAAVELGVVDDVAPLDRIGDLVTSLIR